ncbi:hypothetical protein KAZ01_00945 [Candidatus Gracilibacteria bacterium]|nr:hypothetical protein [Candidatus Gracilibacteria bacterium]
MCNSSDNNEKLFDTLIKQFNSENVPINFESLIKLRDLADERTISIYENILQKHLKTTNIYGYAAAQGLYNIGNKKCLQILDKYLLSENYYSTRGIKYTFHWKMDKNKRNAFIKDYHLKNSSNDLVIDLKVDKIEKNIMKFQISIKNVSNNDLKLNFSDLYLGDLLQIESNDGDFLNKSQYVDYEFVNKVEVLKPNTTKQYTFTGEVKKKINTNFFDMFSNMEQLKESEYLLVFNDIFHILKKYKEYNVYAIYEYPKIFADNSKEKNLWYGRVVSNAVKIQINY